MIERWKDPSQFTPSEHLRSQRGERIETDEYVQARADALAEAGLEPESTQTKDRSDMSADELAAMSAEAHLRHLQENR